MEDSRNKGMRNFVAGKGDVVILKETSANHVAKGVIFLIEGEDGGRRDT